MEDNQQAGADILTVIGAILLFFCLLAFIAWVKSRTKEKFVITNTEIILALFPFVIYLLLSGKLTSLKYGDLQIETAFVRAQNKDIEKQISEIQPTIIKATEKGRLDELERKLSTKPEAMVLVAGYGNYSAYAMETYLDVLSKSTVKYCIFQTLDDKFIGIISIYDLNSQLAGPSGFSPGKIERFTDALVYGNINEIKSFKGLISSEYAVNESTKKKEALRKIQQANSSYIPIVNTSGEFQGILEASKLTSSLLLDVSEAISQNN